VNRQTETTELIVFFVAILRKCLKVDSFNAQAGNCGKHCDLQVTCQVTAVNLVTVLNAYGNTSKVKQVAMSVYQHKQFRCGGGRGRYGRA